MINIDRGTYGLNYFTVERMANQGYAPSLYECYVWRDPITEENVISKYIVRTSKYENFGLGVIEAMARGVPVVAPNATTFPEVIGYETLLYKPEDPSNLAEKVITILNTADLYNSIKEHLLVRVREYFDIRKLQRSTWSCILHLRVRKGDGKYATDRRHHAYVEF